MGVGRWKLGDSLSSPGGEGRGEEAIELRREERLGRAVILQISAASEYRRAPLPNPLPARSSQGEGEDSICRALI